MHKLIIIGFFTMIADHNFTVKQYLNTAYYNRLLLMKNSGVPIVIHCYTKLQMWYMRIIYTI